jgi:hypothetical protein
MSMDLNQERPWWQPRGFLYSAAEMWVMRAAFALLAFMNVKWETRRYVEQKFGHGLGRVVDFTWLAEHPPGVAVQGLTAVALVPYVLGRFSSLSLLPLAFFSISIGTLVTSQSKNVNHTWQLVSLILCAQLACYLWAAVKKKELAKPSIDTQRLVIHASAIVFAASYVVSAVTKLINSNGLWIWKAPLLSVQLMKSNMAQYYDTLVKPPAWLEQAVQYTVDYPNLARLFFGTGLLIELFAFAVLISRRWALVGGLVIILLHLSISKVMQLDFEYHMIAALIFCVNLPGLKKTLRGEP